MNEHEEFGLDGNDPDSDPVCLELVDQITQRLQAGEPVDAGEYFGHYPSGPTS